MDQEGGAQRYGGAQQLEELGREYKQYLLTERGLSQRSVKVYWDKARLFLRERFGPDIAIVTAQITPRDLSAFVRARAYEHSLNHARLVVVTLRAFLRFLRWRGDFTVDLAGAVPGVAGWGHETVPHRLAPEQGQRVLDGCERTSIVGKRNYAIVLLLARLGLRAGEVAALTLEDLNWPAGEMTVRGKGERYEKLPLAEDVGSAVAEYLVERRPRANTRSVFVSAYPPPRTLRAERISSIARSALVRAGVATARGGAHVFRHSLATDLLRHGATLSEIGQVLRHQHISTTEIYAKVDLWRLRTVAQPWPGGAS
jgi:site-specific recombinase XerD